MVTKKIDKWHDEMTKKRRRSFKEDKDFVEMGNSPSRFNSSSESEEEINVELD